MVNRTLRPSASRRVYTILAGLLLLGAAPAAAQVRISVDPAMTRGAAKARVTIIEFSDYQ